MKSFDLDTHLKKMAEEAKITDICRRRRHLINTLRDLDPTKGQDYNTLVGLMGKLEATVNRHLPRNESG